MGPPASTTKKLSIPPSPSGQTFRLLTGSCRSRPGFCLFRADFSRSSPMPLSGTHLSVSPRMADLRFGSAQNRVLAGRRGSCCRPTKRIGPRPIRSRSTHLRLRHRCSLWHGVLGKERQRLYSKAWLRVSTPADLKLDASRPRVTGALTVSGHPNLVLVSESK